MPEYTLEPKTFSGGSTKVAFDSVTKKEAFAKMVASMRQLIDRRKRIPRETPIGSFLLASNLHVGLIESHAEHFKIVLGLASIELEPAGARRKRSARLVPLPKPVPAAP
jgi:hypothetical protein